MRKRRTQRERHQFAIIGMRELKDKRLYTGIIATMREHEALMREYDSGYTSDAEKLIADIKSLHHIK